MTDQRTGEHSSPPPTFAEISTAKAYVDEVARFAIGNLSYLPLELKAKLRAFYKSPSVDLQGELAEKMTRQAVDMTNRSYQREAVDPDDIHQRAVFFMLVCTNMCSEFKKQTIGDTGPETSLTGMISEQVAYSLPLATTENLEPVRKTADALLHTQDRHYIWYEAKIAHMYRAMIEKREFYDYLNAHEPLHDYTELKGANDQLSVSTRYLQRYLPKQCIAPALPGSSTQEWLVVPPFEAWRKNRFHPAYTRRVSIFGSKDVIPSVTTDIHDLRKETYVQMATIDGINGSNKTVGASIGEDGELYSIYGQRLLDNLPEHMRGAYEKLRSELLCIYHDSVVPVYVTELVDQEIKINEPKEPESDREPFTGLRRLVLARKLIDDTLQEEITDELENPQQDVVKHRSMVRHEVTGFIRKLPKYYRASQAARNQCYRDMGVILAEYGETYVREHKRGSLENKAAGHKAAFAAGRMATARQNIENHTE